MWLALPVLLISVSLGPTFSEMCLRHVSYHYICHDDYDLTHLNLLFNITETLLQEGTITSSRADVMKRTLQFSSHTLCDPGYSPARPKRQVISGTIGLVSGLILPLIFKSLIYPSGNSIDLSKFHDFALRTRGIARSNQHRIFKLQNRMNLLSRREDINSLFDNVVQSLQLEERKFSEMVSNGAHFSPSLYHMLKVAISRYQKAGVIDPRGRHSLGNSPLIPEEAIHVNVSTVSNINCDLAMVNITVYTPIPSSSCEPIIAMMDSYTVTKISNGDCRIVAPLRGLIHLPDRTYLSPSNYFIAPNCSFSNFSFSYSEDRKTIFALPKQKGGMVATCGGGVHRDTIEQAVGIAPSPSCSAYLSSGHIAPGVGDLYHPGTWLLNSQGNFLDAGHIPQVSYAFVEQATTSTSSTSTTTPAPSLDYLEMPTTTTSSSMLLTAVYATVPTFLIVTTIILLWKCGVFNRRSNFVPAEPKGKLRLEDIQVLDLPKHTDELTIARLQNIRSDLDGVRKPEHGIRLLSMKSLALSKETCSRNSSFSEEYETPDVLIPDNAT